MNLHFLGGFLLAEGSVTPEQLAMAMAHQARANRRIGELAREMGLLDAGQVEEILRLQANTDLSFGELATAGKYLNRKSLNDLLFHQNVLQVHLGEALLATGALTPAQFHSALERFALADADQRAAISLLLAGYEEQRELTILLSALERAFPRFAALPLKTCGLLPAGQIDALPHTFGLVIERPGRDDLRIFLKMDESMLRLLARGLTGAAPGGGAGAGLEAAGFFFQVVSQYCRQNLAALGENARCRAPGCEARPACASPAWLRLSLVCPDAAMGLVASCCPKHGTCAERIR